MKDANTNSLNHLQNVHRKIIDSIKANDVGVHSKIFDNIIKTRVNALLFSEETINFFQYNLKIFPTDLIKYAIAYLMKILSIVLKYNDDKDQSHELTKLVIKQAARVYHLDKDDLQPFYKMSCGEIVSSMEKEANFIDFEQ